MRSTEAERYEFGTARMVREVRATRSDGMVVPEIWAVKAERSG